MNFLGQSPLCKLPPIDPLPGNNGSGCAQQATPGLTPARPLARPQGLRVMLQPATDTLGPPLAALGQAVQLLGVQAWQGVASMWLAVGSLLYAVLAPLMHLVVDLWAGLAAAMAPVLLVSEVGRDLWRVAYRVEWQQPLAYRLPGLQLLCTGCCAEQGEMAGPITWVPVQPGTPLPVPTPRFSAVLPTACPPAQLPHSSWPPPPSPAGGLQHRGGASGLARGGLAAPVRRGRRGVGGAGGGGAGGVCGGRGPQGDSLSWQGSAQRSAGRGVAGALWEGLVAGAAAEHELFVRAAAGAGVVWQGALLGMLGGLPGPGWGAVAEHVPQPTSPHHTYRACPWY